MTRLLTMTCIALNGCRGFAGAAAPTWWRLVGVGAIACWGWNAQAAVTFAPVVTYAIGVNPYWIALGDFNADSNLDISVTNPGSNTVSVLLGKMAPLPIPVGQGSALFQQLPLSRFQR